MDDSTESKLQRTYKLIKAGKRAEAREILIPLSRANPESSDVWLLLGYASSDPQEKIGYFQQVLRLEPENQQAQKQLSLLLSSPRAVSPVRAAKPAVTQRTVRRKKRNPALLWGITALLGTFICISGLGLAWNFRPAPFSSPTPTATDAPPTLLPDAFRAATSTPRYSPTPKPTARPSSTLLPTSTPQPSVTIIPTTTLTPTITLVPTLSPTPKKFNGCTAAKGLGEHIGVFKIENFGKEGTTVFIDRLTKDDDYPITCQIDIKQNKPVTLTLTYGNYEYSIVRGKSTRSGNFYIDKPDKSTMRIYDDKILIGPYP